MPEPWFFVYFVFFVVTPGLLSIRVHSCPLVVQNMATPRFFVYFVFFVVTTWLLSFVSISGSKHAHTTDFRVFRVFRGYPPPLLSISVH